MLRENPFRVKEDGSIENPIVWFELIRNHYLIHEERSTGQAIPLLRMRVSGGPATPSIQLFIDTPYHNTGYHVVRDMKKLTQRMAALVAKLAASDMEKRKSLFKWNIHWLKEFFEDSFAKVNPDLYAY